MFRRLIENVSFSPALVGQLGFYARRLKQEEATRRIGLIFTALALVVQSVAVFSAPEAANAASGNDMIYGGISSHAEMMTAYDRDQKFRNVMNMAGITRSELAKADTTYVNNLEFGTGSNAWRSYGYHSRFSSAQGEIKHNADGTTVFSRPHYLYGRGLNMKVIRGYSEKLGSDFAIQYSCGNLWTPGTPTPPPPPPPPPPAPVAECDLLTAIRVSDTKYKFRAKARAENGATISKYTVVVTNSAGKTVKTLSVSSSNSDVTTEDITLEPGSYSAQVTVATSQGNKTGSKCKTSFTVPTPGVSVTKKVNGKEIDQVDVNEDFTYQIVVKNTGSTTLRDVVVTDEQPAGVTFRSASDGSIANDTWTHTIASLAPGATKSYELIARATETVSADQSKTTNTVCVDTGSIDGQPDDCDDAVVELPENEIRVCDLVNNEMITIRESEFDENIHSNDPDDCVRIQVCDLATDTVITIRKSEFDDDKHSRNLDECEKIQVCDLESGEIITIARNDYDSEKHSDDAADCVPAVSESKEATNITQDGTDATTVTAQAGDVIKYTITLTNRGKVAAEGSFVEQLDDVLEYASILNEGGGEFDSEAKTLSWPDVTLAAGESESRIFTVKLASTIPAGAQGVSDAASYDCVMINTFGNATEVDVNCPAVKGVETTVKELPTTGPTANMIFGGVLLAVVTYFYARSRQLKTEVRLIRRDLNSGHLQS